MKKHMILTCIFLNILVFSASAQTRTITGIVTDEEEGIGLPNATIMETGSTKGVTSGLDGRFSITVTGKTQSLTISYIGYVPQEVQLGSSNHYYVVLQVASTAMEEIVVVGYGQQTKASVVGAITQIESGDLERASTPNLTNALAGRASGIITVMGSGKPGDDDSKIYVRGQSTPNGSDPLVLVDGVERDWKEIDPNDIESFSVLKDASATAVFGVRGGNGVILVTTKRGKKGKPVLKINSQTSFQQAIRLPDYLGSYDYATLFNEASVNDEKTPIYTNADLEHYLSGDSPYTHPDNDYYKDFLQKTAVQQTVNLSASGGTDFLTYYISGNFLTQEGLYKSFPNANYPTNNRYTRYNFRSNLDFNVTRTTKIGVDLTGRLEVRNQPSNNSAIFDRIQKLPPNWQPYLNPDGSLNNKTRDLFNPLIMIAHMGYRWNYNNVFEGTFKIDQQLDFIAKGLNVKLLAGLNSSYKSYRYINDEPDAWSYDKTGQYLGDLDRVEIAYSRGEGPANRNTSYQLSLNYDRTFGNHAVTGMLIYLQDQTWTEFKVPFSYLGFAGRATYKYKLKYLAEFNVGYNGSTNFAKGQRYDVFPAFSLGWVVSEESFWKDHISFMDYLKIRGSFGVIGNDKIGDFQYFYEQLYLYSAAGDGNQIYWGEVVASGGQEKGILEGKLGNDQVTWEKANKGNLGIDMRLFRSRLSLSADVFFEKRNNILAIPYSIPLILGMGLPSDKTRGLPPSNIGKVENRGFDLELGFQDRINDFDYFIKGNFTFARNKNTYIDEENVVYEWQSRKNRPIGQLFGLTDIGLYQVSDFDRDPNGSLILTDGIPTLRDGLPVPSFGPVYPGDCRYEDLNNDGVIDVFDKGAIGKSKIPEYSYGVTVGASYKGIDLTVLFQGAGGANMPLNQFAIWEFYTTTGGNGKVMRHHLDRYVPDDPGTWETASYPRLHSGTNANNHQSSTRWMFDRSYLRLKNIELGYRLPQRLISGIGLSACRIYVSGNNLYTWDHMMSWDPESSSESGSAYPQVRTWNVGISLTF